ncbi:CTD small phosphatase-like protein 2 [Coemansia guatemalensis]|uniref:CTD small phosphatase-like protein 2 n=1 Tax=Coemansia guatemalensis TaxID=2761395 RepID=A0A9W8LQR6_9FUNG|nr:CTD small phosphatase-like protein 2 [Coemansia guatemalensis]
MVRLRSGPKQQTDVVSDTSKAAKPLRKAKTPAVPTAAMLRKSAAKTSGNVNTDTIAAARNEPRRSRRAAGMPAAESADPVWRDQATTAAATANSSPIQPQPTIARPTRARTKLLSTAKGPTQTQKVLPAKDVTVSANVSANGSANTRPATGLTRKRKLGTASEDHAQSNGTAGASTAPAGANFIMSSPKRKPREALSRLSLAGKQQPAPGLKRRSAVKNEYTLTTGEDTNVPNSPGFHTPLAKRQRQAHLGRSVSEGSGISTPTRDASQEPSQQTSRIAQTNGDSKSSLPPSPLKGLLSPAFTFIRRVSGFMQGTASSQGNESDSSATSRTNSSIANGEDLSHPSFDITNGNLNGDMSDDMLPLMPGSFARSTSLQEMDEAGAPAGSPEANSLTAPPMNPTSLGSTGTLGMVSNYMSSSMQLRLPESQEIGGADSCSTSPATLGYPETPSKENIPIYSEEPSHSTQLDHSTAGMGVAAFMPMVLDESIPEVQQPLFASGELGSSGGGESDMDISQVSSLAVSEIDQQYDAYMTYEDEDDELNPYLFMANLPPIPREHTLRPYALPRKTRSSPPITLVLDLDETLVHCALTKVDNADLVFQVEYNAVNYDVYCRLRPGYKEFLERASKLFEVVVFTASQQVYADQLLNWIDPERRYIRHRLFRDSCVYVNTNYVKDLGILGRDESKLLLVDNCPQAYAYQQSNGIPIESWYEDKNDCELMQLMEFLETLVGVEDVRPRVEARYRTKEKVVEAKRKYKSRVGIPYGSGPIYVRGL